MQQVYLKKPIFGFTQVLPISMLVKIEAFLWTHKITKSGEHGIRLRLTPYKEVVYLSTEYTLTIENWDKENDCPKPTHPQFKSIIKK